MQALEQKGMRLIHGLVIMAIWTPFMMALGTRLNERTVSWQELSLYAVAVAALLIVAVIRIAKQKTSPGPIERSFSKLFRAAFGSFAVIFGYSMLLSVLALPLVGVEGFFMASPSFPVFWLAAAASVFPLVYRHMS
jgi:hypothetical protein